MGTPQYFVDNEALPWVKGATGRIPDLLAEGAKKPRPFDVTASAVLEKGKVRVTWSLERRELAEEAAPEVSADLDVVPVLVLEKATTKIPRGENEGKTLTEHRIALASGTPTDVAAALKETQSASFDAPKGTEASGLRVALLIENSAELRTLDAFDLPVKPAATKPTKSK